MAPSIEPAKRVRGGGSSPSTASTATFESRSSTGSASAVSFQHEENGGSKSPILLPSKSRSTTKSALLNDKKRESLRSNAKVTPKRTIDLKKLKKFLLAKQRKKRAVRQVKTANEITSSKKPLKQSTLQKR